MARVDRDAVVRRRPALVHELPVALLLAQVEAGRVREEYLRQDNAQEPEPGHHPEAGRGVDVVVQDRGCEGAELAASGREPVCRRTDGRWVTFRGCEKLRSSSNDISLRWTGGGGRRRTVIAFGPN